MKCPARNLLGLARDLAAQVQRESVAMPNLFEVTGLGELADRFLSALDQEEFDVEARELGLSSRPVDDLPADIKQQAV